MTQASMADVAYAALNQEGGITRFFDNADYPSPDACKRAMVSFRNKFYAFKAKERKAARRKFNGHEDTMYDTLGCSVEATPTGWRLIISPATFNASDFVDAEGKPIDWKRLASERELVPPLSEDNYRPEAPEPIKLWD